MASNQKNRERRVDATPYGGCTVVAIIIVLIFIAACWLLWTFGGSVKHWAWGFLPLGSDNLQQDIDQALTGVPTINPGSAIEQGQQLLQDQADAAAARAAEAATEAAKDALNQGVQDGANQLRELLP
jgi:hypothetical protein